MAEPEHHLALARCKDLPIPPFIAATCACQECDEPCWLPASMILQATFWPCICMACVIARIAKDPEGAEMRLTPDTRERMRASGMSDRTIDLVFEAFKASVFAEARSKN